MDSTCSIDGCSRAARRRDWCGMHYDRIRIHGEPNPPGLRAWSRKPDVCTVDTCDRAPHARGWCVMHYDRWKRHGTPEPANLRRWTHQDPICSIDGCVKPTAGRGWCQMHLARWQKHGDPGAAEPMRHPGKTCSIPGCDLPHDSRGWCATHYKRWTVHGDPLGYTRPGNYAGDDVGYIGVHHRVRTERGPASAYLCEHCGLNAAHWAFDHSDPDPRFHSDGRPFSVDLNCYIPLCAACHAKLDRRMAAERREPSRRAAHPGPSA